MNSNPLIQVIEHAFYVHLKIAKKRGAKIAPNGDFFYLFFIVWWLKATKFAKQLIRLRISVINPFAFKKYLFVFVTHNQYLALLSVSLKLKSESTSIRHPFFVPQGKLPASNLPFLYIYFLDFVTFPFYYFYFKKFLINNYGTFINSKYLLNVSSLTIAYYGFFNLMFWVRKPKYLVMANDHSEINVAILHAAKRNNIKTFYFQHANVSEIFPPLKFDYAFLYSELAANIYTRIQPSKTCMLCVGNIKADPYLDTNRDRVFDADNLRIVLSINSITELDTYRQLAKELTNLENVRLIKFRLHPALSDIALDFEHPKITISDAKMENSFECFKDMDIQVAGNSSIIEESLFMDTPTVYLDLDENLSDYYGYVKKGIVVDTFNDIERLIGFIRNYQFPISVVTKSCLYSSSVNTPFSGKTNDLVARIFREIDDETFSQSQVMEKDPRYQFGNVFRIIE